MYSKLPLVKLMAGSFRSNHDTSRWSPVVNWTLENKLQWNLDHNTDIFILHSWKKGCYTSIWCNKIDMHRMFVPPVVWNWHEMYLWLLPNKIRPYLSRIFTLVASGIVEVQNCSLGRHFPKSAFALWQVRINNCIFSQFSLIVLIMLCPTLIGIKHEVLALAREGMRQSVLAGHVGLTHATVNCIFRRRAATGTLVPDRSTGRLGRNSVKTAIC